MLKKTFDMGCDREKAIHYCFVCGTAFEISDAIYCEKCNWWKAPCGHCACQLNPEQRMSLEAAFFQVCGGTCKINPKKKKRRSSDIIRGVSREDFIKWTEKILPDLYSEYKAGRLSFEDLVRQASIRTGLVWVFD